MLSKTKKINTGFYKLFVLINAHICTLGSPDDYKIINAISHNLLQFDKELLRF